MESLCGIKIAIQRRGKLSEESIAYLASLGLEFNLAEDRLAVRCDNYDATILQLRDDDIPRLVAEGYIDFGIVGENVLCEQELQDLPILEKLGFGACRLVIATPQAAGIAKLSDLTRKRIATAYPRLLSSYLASQGIAASIVTVSGSAELIPLLNAADAICDLTQTGRTLRENNLMELITIFESQAVLIASPVKNSLPSQFSPLCKSSLPIKTR